MKSQQYEGGFTLLHKFSRIFDGRSPVPNDFWRGLRKGGWGRVYISSQMLPHFWLESPLNEFWRGLRKVGDEGGFTLRHKFSRIFGGRSPLPNEFCRGLRKVGDEGELTSRPKFSRILVGDLAFLMNSEEDWGRGGWGRVYITSLILPYFWWEISPS